MASSDEGELMGDVFVRNLLHSSSSESDFSGFSEEDVHDRYRIPNRGVIAQLPLIDFQPAINREFDTDIQNGWKNEESDFIVRPFESVSKLNVEMDSHDPIDFLRLFIDDDFLQIMVNETNAYAQTKLNGPLQQFSRMRKWEPVSLAEMKVFMALVITMGIVHKSDIEQYWATETSTETPFFGKTMSRDKFLNILSSFHLSTVDNQEDPLRRIRPMMIRTMERFSDIYTPEENLSFDEATCPWKGRLKFKVFNPNKPNRFGVKLYTVCESSSGYCFGYDIYAGRADNINDVNYYEALNPQYRHLTLTSRTVLGLMTRCGLLGHGHKVYMDNYYTSPELFEELLSEDTYACGTLRVNRVGVPEAIRSKTIKLLETECVFRRRENLMAVKFKDKRDVHMLSSFHPATMAVMEKKKFRTDTNVMKPQCIVDYCRHMGGVDLCDQFGHYNSIARKTKKWWRKMFFYLFNMTMVNAYVLYGKFSPEDRKKDHRAFRFSIVNALLREAGNAAVQPVKRGRPILGEIPGRLCGRHFPSYIPAKEGAKRARPLRDCAACNPGKKNRDGHKRKQTSFWCSDCKVSLCVPECFEVFHTHMNFQQQLNG